MKEQAKEVKYSTMSEIAPWPFLKAQAWFVVGKEGSGEAGCPSKGGMKSGQCDTGYSACVLRQERFTGIEQRKAEDEALHDQRIWAVFFTLHEKRMGVTGLSEIWEWVILPPFRSRKITIFIIKMNFGGPKEDGELGVLYDPVEGQTGREGNNCFC